MGLDTTAYNTITHLPGYQPRDPDDGDYEWDNDILEVFAYRDFPHALDGLPGRDTPHPDMPSFIGGEWFQASGPTATTSSSYLGHNLFRDLIAQRVLGLAESSDVADYPDAPFYDLLWFADNEGCIGPVASRRLADAFNAHPDLDLGEPFANRLYQAFKVSFNLAADTGTVRFH
jgi:hypothetical protein